ncbi:MAG: hypothetical protein WBM55_00665, partial [Muriicola sp.]
GTTITTELVASYLENCDCRGLNIEGYVYNEDEATVFPDGIPYYFEDVTNADNTYLINDDTVTIPAGSYSVKISDPQNYTAVLDVIGILTVNNKELIVSGNTDGEPYEIVYGGELTPEILEPLIAISGLADEVITDIFQDGIIPYFLEEVSEEPQVFSLEDQINAGQYVVRITMPESNYSLVYEDPLVIRIVKKELTFNADSFEKVYGIPITSEDINKFDNPSESAIPVLQGFEYEDTAGDIFGEEIPYVFIPSDSEQEFPLGDALVAGDYQIRIETEVVNQLTNYTIFYEDGEGENNSLEITKADLTFNADYIEKEYGEEITASDILKDGGESQVLQGFAYGENPGDLFGASIPYVLVPEGEEGETEIPFGSCLDVGFYNIRIANEAVEQLANYTVLYQDGEGANNKLAITKADLFVCIGDVEIREGDLLTQDMINATISYLCEDDESIFLPNGITYVVVEEIDGKPEETIIPSGGLVLGEGIYTIKIQEVELTNYSIADGEACSSSGQVNVSACGDALALDFSNYTFDALFGKYRFANVATGLDALVTLQTRGTVRDFVIDDNNFHQGSEDRKQLRPLVSFTITEAVPEPYLEYSIELVNSGTNTPANITADLIAGVLDVDGTGAYQEYVEINLPQQYTLEGGTSPSQVEVVENPTQGILRVNGFNNSYTSTFNGEPRVNVEVSYEGRSSLIYRVGARGHTGQVSTRQFGVQFSCLTNFSSPVKMSVEDSGNPMQTTAYESECVIYNNPIGAANNYILNLERKEDVTGAATIKLTNMETMQHSVFEFSATDSIEIDMALLDSGLYIVQTNIGHRQCDSFIIIRKE